MSEETGGLDEAALRRLLGTTEVQALLARLREHGRGTAAGQDGGQPPPASPQALEQALGPAALERLEQASGMPRQRMLATLAALLTVGLGELPEEGGSDIPGHAGPGFGYGGAPPGRERDPPRG